VTTNFRVGVSHLPSHHCEKFREIDRAYVAMHVSEDATSADKEVRMTVAVSVNFVDHVLEFSLGRVLAQ